jgi:hypothetical protein
MNLFIFRNKPLKTDYPAVDITCGVFISDSGPKQGIKKINLL